MAARLKERYESEIKPQLMERFGYSSVMQVPRLREDHPQHGRRRGQAGHEDARRGRWSSSATIAGQKPAVRRARKSIAGFKLREGMPVGVMVTLRGERMWEMLDRLQSIAIPRIRDFRGLEPALLRRPRQLLDGPARADHLSRDRLRRDRPGPRPERHDHDHGRDRRGGPRAAADAGHAVPQRGRRGPTAAEMRQAQEEADAKRRPRSRPREQLEGGAPASPRTAAEPRQPSEPRRRAAARRAAEHRERIGANGKDLTDSPPAARKQVQDTQLQSLPPVRQLAGVLPEVRPVPDLPAGDRPPGHDPRHDEVLLVEPTPNRTRELLDRLRRRLPDAHPQRASTPTTTTSSCPPRA